jgi:hypothetical protein
MTRRKYPDAFKNLIDFESGTTEVVPELEEERQARLRRERDMRRRSAEAKLKASAHREREAALAKAFRLAYAGKPFPIHFDVVFVVGEQTKTERFALVNAVFSNRVDTPGLVGHPSASKICPSPPADIPPDFVHRVCLKTD